VNSARSRKKQQNKKAIVHRAPELPVLPTSPTWSQRARGACSTVWAIMTYPIRRCLVKVSDLAIDQMELETTYVGTTANVIRLLPLAVKPWPMIATQVAWTAWTYSALGVAYRFLPYSRYRTFLLVSISLTGNACRFIEDQHSAFIGLIGLLILHSRLVNNRFSDRYFSKAMQNEIRAALYLLIWEHATLYKYAQRLFPKSEFEVFSLNKPAVKKFKKILNLDSYNPLVDDERFYHIHKNVDHLGQEKIRIYLGHHGNKTQRYWESISTAAQSQPGDKYVLEGYFSMRAVNCSEYSGVTRLAYGKQQIRAEIPVTASCIGGDNVAIIARYQDRRESLDAIVEAFTTLDEMEQRIMRMPYASAVKNEAANLVKENCKLDLRRICQFVDDFIQSVIDSICDLQAEASIHAFSEEVRVNRRVEILTVAGSKLTDSREIISLRNQNLFDTMMKSSQGPEKVDVMFGAAHFIDPDYKMSETPFKVGPSAPQREIWEKLDKSGVGYSLRYPRR